MNKGKMLGCVRRKIGKYRKEGKTELAKFDELCEVSNHYWPVASQTRPAPVPLEPGLNTSTAIT
jgi:hypothetical protein